MWKEERVSERMYKRERERDRSKEGGFASFSQVCMSSHPSFFVIWISYTHVNVLGGRQDREERRGIVMGDRKSDGMERKGFFDEEG